MADHDDTPARVRWARLRFAIIGPLLASPPGEGELKDRLNELAARAFRHPTTGDSVRFSFKTVERWFYAARGVTSKVSVWPESAATGV